MPLLNASPATLIMVDLQGRLMPAIHGAADVILNAGRLLAAAKLLAAPVLVTEQNPSRLGNTVPELAVPTGVTIEKMSFDSCRAPGFLTRVPADHVAVVFGAEAHVCVLQTVLGLMAAGRRVAVVADAIGSRQPASKATALERMARHGADVVTTEMVVFEWLGSADHPQFRAASALIK